MSPQLEPIDFQAIVEKFPERWEESVRHPVERINDDTFSVNDDESAHSVRLLKRGNNWYTWCGCEGFDGLEFCIHVFSVARTIDRIEVELDQDNMIPEETEAEEGQEEVDLDTDADVDVEN